MEERGNGCPSAKAGGRSLNLRSSQSNSQEMDRILKDKKAQTTNEASNKIIIQNDDDLRPMQTVIQI